MMVCVSFLTRGFLKRVEGIGEDVECGKAIAVWAMAS